MEVRYVFVMLLAICDPTGHVIGTDVAIARRINMPVPDFQKCIAALMEPDPDSNSKEEDGRRVIQSDHERGYKVVNYLTYRDMKSEEEKRTYMREYMRKRRELQREKANVKRCKTVLNVLADVTHAEAEAEGEEKAEGVPPSIPTAAHSRQRGIVEGKNSDRIPTTPQSQRIATLFKRRLTTSWSEKEVTAYKRIGTISDDDLAALERYYIAGKLALPEVVSVGYAGVTASSNFDLNTTQKQARETTHKQARGELAVATYNVENLDPADATFDAHASDANTVAHSADEIPVFRPM